MPEEIEAEVIKPLRASVVILRPDAIDCIEDLLDRIHPAWRRDVYEHRYAQPPTDAHYLMRVRELACRGYGVTVALMDPLERREAVRIAQRAAEGG